MGELFDPIIRVTLLEQCERFSRETGASMSIQCGYPLIEYEGIFVEVHLSKFHVELDSYSAPMVKVNDGAWLIRYYFENLVDYRNLKKALLSCFGKKAKIELYRIPSFRIPEESYRYLMSAKRVYLDYDFHIVEDYRLSTYVFIIFCDGCIQYCHRWGLDKQMFRTCEVTPLKAATPIGSAA